MRTDYGEGPEVIRWAVEKVENKVLREAGQRTLGGDRIASTIEEAKAIAEEMNAEADRKAKRLAELKAQEEAVDPAEAMRMAGLEGFVSGMKPMPKARAIESLNKIVTRKGKTQPLKELIEQLVADGWTVDDDRTYGRIIKGSDGTFIEQKRITKIGLDFAEYLIAQRNAAPAATEVTGAAAAVDAAYAFSSASDAFKEAVAGSVNEADYSAFKSAMTIDKAAQAAGLSVSWDLAGSAVLDSAGEMEGEDEDDDGEMDDGDEGDDFDAEDEWNETPEHEAAEEAILDGDFKGHPFRGNQHKKAHESSGSAGRACGTAASLAAGPAGAQFPATPPAVRFVGR
jgi:hypothetical protein